MKKIFGCVAAIALLTGCDSQQYVNNKSEIVVIDGCQYIFIDSGAGQCRVIALTHKGNCTNTIHVYNK